MDPRPANAPLVSVIIPAFQAARYIGDTLASAQRQTLQNIEILVVDDGSTDETADVVAATAEQDPRIKLIRQENAGVAAARNRAIESARAPYLAPLDADDLWRPDKLARQVEALEAQPAGAVMAYAWYLAIDRDGRIVGPVDFRPSAAGNALHEFALQNVVGASSPLLRRATVLGVGGYDPSLHERGGQGSEDWKLFVQMAASGAVAMVPRFLMGYRRVPDSMSREYRPALLSHLLAVSDVRQAYPEIPRTALLWSELIHASFMTRTYVRERSWASAARTAGWAAGHAIRRDPRFLTRPALRAYLAMRRARRADDRQSAVDSVHNQPFLSADLSGLEHETRPRLAEARATFVAATAR